MRRQAKHIDAEGSDVKRDAAGRLHGVTMNQSAAFVRQRCDIDYRLNDAGFIVGQHDGHKHIIRILAEHLVQRL